MIEVTSLSFIPDPKIYLKTKHNHLDDKKTYIVTDYIKSIHHFISMIDKNLNAQK